MQVTSLLSQQEEHDHSCGSCADHGHGHTHVVLPLKQTLLGLILVLNSYFVEWCFGAAAKPVVAVSAMAGAIVLGFPILVAAIKDLRRGLLTTNELVALA